MKVIVPVAGYATRLYPLTVDRPKALLEVGGKLVLDHVVEKVSKLKDVDEVIVVSNNKFYHLFEAWARLANFGIKVSVLDDGTNSEDDRLGAVGDIVFALRKKKVDEDTLIVLGDNLFSFDLKEFLKENRITIGLFDVGDVEIARKMGTPTLGESNKIVKFVEKDSTTDSSLCSTGLYAFAREDLKWFYEYVDSGENPDKIGDFVSWLCLRSDVYGYIFPKEDYWFDIGSIEALKEANDFLVRIK